MDYRSLVNKLEAIANGVVAEDRAEYDKFKADDAKAAAVEKVKQYASIPLNQIPRLGNAIDPKTGIIYYGDAGGEAGNVTPKKMPLQFMSQPDQKPMLDAIKAAGLEVVPQEEKTLFGSAQYAKVDVSKLADIISGIVPVDNTALLEKLKKLIELVDKYLALKAKRSGKAPAPAPATGQNPNIDDATRQRAQASVAGLKEGLIESFGYETKTDEGLGSLVGKAMPGVGLALGTMGAVDSYKKGDYLGAALNGLSGALSLIPGVGWIPALGLGMWQAGRELAGATNKQPQHPQQSANPTVAGGKDPKVQELQKKLIAAGADLGPTGADGVMGKYTQAAMQKFPNIKEGTQMKSVAESIRDLQSKLALIEADAVEAGAEAAGGAPEPEPATGEETSLAKKLEQAGGKLMEKDGRQFMVLPDKGLAIEVPSMEIVDASTPELKGTGKTFNPAEFGLNEDSSLEEGFWDALVRGATKLAPKFAQGVKTGFNKGALSPATAARAGMQNKAGNLVGRGGKAVSNAGAAIKNNPIKTGLGVGAAGLAGGYLTGANAGTPGGAGNPSHASGSGAGGTTGGAGNTDQDDAEMAELKKQIDALIAELSTSQDPAIQKGLTDIKTKLGSGTPAPTAMTQADGATPLNPQQRR